MYRNKDVEAIKNIMPELSDKIQEKKLMILDPNIQEINQVNSIIHNFIKNKKRVVYGGFAQNILIGKKNKEDEFYGKLDTPDIEFYTPTPIEDMIELCNTLYKKGFQRVQGQEGVHNETYKVFVNFEDYCDISYMPRNIYNQIPTRMIDGMRITDPLFMLIDSFRVYSDPMTSWWRIEKSFKRTELILKHYPIPKNDSKLKIKFETKPDSKIKSILRYIRKRIFHKMESLVVIGFYAYNYYMKKAKLPNLLVLEPYYDLISIDYNNDIQKIYDILKAKYGKDLTTKEFYPFFQFTGKSTMYLYNGKKILQVYDRNNRCIVFNMSQHKKVKIGTLQLLILYVLIGLAYSQINKIRFEEFNFKIMLSNLIYARDTYLERNNLTIVDKSPFMEFSIDCIGETIEQTRIQRLQIEERKKKKKPLVFRYEPTNKEKKIPNYVFDNSSGNQVTNSKYTLIKNK
ncbi:hypothetical protein CPAV1605_456 [seawater metagenome]|uniref:Uncharacterized protein n=1 Tax=seawater metagenome TaxID=1561972 RepID=A0A5E8CHL6_9ZZZZ